MAEAPTESPDRLEKDPDFYLRSAPVLPELHWVGAAIQEGRFDELVAQIPESTYSEESLERIYGTADPAVPLEEIRERFERLAEIAEWDDETFLAVLVGFAGRTENLPEPPAEAPDIKALHRVNTYLELLEEMLEPIEPRFDRRHLIHSGAEMLDLTGGLSNVDTLRTALHVTEPTYNNDGLNAWQYLEFGSIDNARDIIKDLFKGASIHIGNPFFTVPKKHLSENRLEAVHSGNIDIIGEQTAQRIRDHVADCAGCGDTWQHLEKRAKEPGRTLPGQHI
jgi:hypothetical protein